MIAVTGAGSASFHSRVLTTRTRSVSSSPARPGLLVSVNSNTVRPGPVAVNPSSGLAAAPVAGSVNVISRKRTKSFVPASSFTGGVLAM